MSNNAHFFAVDPEAVRANWDPEDFFPPTPGLTWCGDTFERSYAFRAQLDDVIRPFLPHSIVDILDGRSESVEHPVVGLLRTNEIGAEITPFSIDEFNELRAGVGKAIQQADWGQWAPPYEWQAFADDRTVAAFYVLAEFV